MIGSNKGWDEFGKQEIVGIDFIIENLEWLSWQKDMPKNIPSGMSLQSFFTKAFMCLMNYRSLKNRADIDNSKKSDELSRYQYPDTSGQ